MKILCSGHLVRYPLGGHSWHHLQYLVGLRQLGHDVTFFEHYGWEDSCYNPALHVMTSNPDYGIAYVRSLLQPYEMEGKWCYLAEDGTEHGMTREALANICRECDLYLNLSNINWIPELEYCRRRVLVDTDPVFSQIGGFGLGGPFDRYHALFTYGENVHRAGCQMPTGGARWLPTRQSVVLDLWPATSGDSAAPFSTVMNWSNFGAKEYQGKVYGQKDREFAPFFNLPNEVGEAMEIAVQAPPGIQARLTDGGWRIQDPRQVARDPQTYQKYLRSSRAEFCVAKHAYVSTRSGWFSDRTTAYLALARPAIVQDTGFSDFLPCDEGLLPWGDYDGAVAAIKRVRANYDSHCRAARRLIEEHFDARKVLMNLLEKSL